MLDLCYKTGTMTHIRRSLFIIIFPLKGYNFAAAAVLCTRSQDLSKIYLRSKLIGTNWYFTRNVKMLTSYELTGYISFLFVAQNIPGCVFFCCQNNCLVVQKCSETSFRKTVNFSTLDGESSSVII